MFCSQVGSRFERGVNFRICGDLLRRLPSVGIGDGNDGSKWNKTKKDD
jgi:hypothetical protein